VFCVFVVGCRYSAPNEDIVRFRCGGKSYTLFAHFFSEIFFHFCIIFLTLGLFVPFDWFFFISIWLVASLYINRICKIGHLSIV